MRYKTCGPTQKTKCKKRRGFCLSLKEHKEGGVAETRKKCMKRQQWGCRGKSQSITATHLIEVVRRGKICSDQVSITFARNSHSRPSIGCGISNVVLGGPARIGRNISEPPGRRTGFPTSPSPESSNRPNLVQRLPLHGCGNVQRAPGIGGNGLRDDAKIAGANGWSNAGEKH